MNYGSEVTFYPLDDKGSTIADFKHYRTGGIDKAMRTYRVKIKVANAQEEMTEFIRFTTELAELRKAKRLTADKEDTTTHPSFIIHFPKVDIDGSYFITKCYSVFLDL